MMQPTKNRKRYPQEINFWAGVVGVIHLIAYIALMFTFSMFVLKMIKDIDKNTTNKDIIHLLLTGLSPIMYILFFLTALLNIVLLVMGILQIVDYSKEQSKEGKLALVAGIINILGGLIILGPILSFMAYRKSQRQVEKYNVNQDLDNHSNQ